MPKIDPNPPYRLPSEGTLRSYGITTAECLVICKRQKFHCPVCQRPFADRQLVVDHEHVRGFRARKTKRKDGKVWKVRVMTPAERKVHVRGILHSRCNTYVRAWLTLERAESILNYLRDHAARKNAR